MGKRINISSGSEFENLVGYSRAVKVGDIIEVSGTTALNQKGQVVGINNPYEQTMFILEKIETVLKSLGAVKKDVVRTRMFVTSIKYWEDVARAHGEFFNNIRPASTLVEVKSLIFPDLLIEIEVTAMLQE